MHVIISKQQTPCCHRIAGSTQRRTLNTFFFDIIFPDRTQWTTGLHSRRCRAPARSRRRLQLRLRRQQTQPLRHPPALPKTSTAYPAHVSLVVSERPAATSTHTAHRAIHHARGVSRNDWSARWQLRGVVDDGRDGRMLIRGRGRGRGRVVRGKATVCLLPKTKAAVAVASHRPVPNLAPPRRRAGLQSA